MKAKQKTLKEWSKLIDGLSLTQETNECKYCVDSKFNSQKIGSENLDIFLVPVNTEQGTKLAMYLDYDAYSGDSSFGETIDINYCPMCGRELKEVTE